MNCYSVWCLYRSQRQTNMKIWIDKFTLLDYNSFLDNTDRHDVDKEIIFLIYIFWSDCCLFFSTKFLFLCKAAPAPKSKYDNIYLKACVHERRGDAVVMRD